MAAPSTRVKVTYSTSFGLEFTVTFHIAAGIVDPNNTGLQAILATINALTGGFALRIEISAVNPHAVTATASAVYVNEDKGEFVFSSSGNSSTFKLPGLKTTILAANLEDIPVTGAVATFTGAVASFALGPGGESLLAPSVGHRRAARKSLKK